MRDDEGDGFRRIVVGVDGSDGATRAVKWWLVAWKEWREHA